MTQTIEDLHVYLRSVRPDERTSLSVLAELVHEKSTILDLGCGSGALGQYLAQTRGCTSDGVTWSPQEADHARAHYRRVEVADLENCDLLTLFGSQRYDYIVCADVLEHLRRPEQILSVCRQLLAPNGRLLTSVPNAGYAGLVAELLQGEFRYRKEGLLDTTHLRFFTRRSLTRFLSEQDWALDSLDTIRRELPESEFHIAFDQLPPSVARYLLGVPDALTYQFIGVAQPRKERVAADQPGQADLDPAYALFTSQLYLGHSGQYAEHEKLTAHGIIGHERQTLTFTLAPSAKSVTRLRLDPADRPGFLHLYSLTLHGSDGQRVWSWDPATATGSLLSHTAYSHILWQSPLTVAAPATLLLLTGDDPWFELPVPENVVALATRTGGVLEVELGWPMSADYLALSSVVQPLHDQIASTQAHAQSERTHAQSERAHLESQMGHVQHALDVAQDTNQQLSAANRVLTQQRADLQDESAKFQRSATRLTHELTRVQRDFNDLASHLKTIESSTVFRATRPVVHAKMRFDRLLGRAPRKTATVAERQARPMQPGPEPVDVIVPVYRGLADTRLCIDSVLASPVRSAYRLIVINDCSPDPEVTAWLRERATQDSRITLLENAENLGFVGTVNRGMALSADNDVLLLNSDTEVANDWLDRIRAAAYGDSRVASVTPFSTNATICSYPRFCKDNALPAGYDTARMDALCARTNPGAVVDVPTGVGFCMYIRRDCLDQVGLFDAQSFGKGYGEENDFCQRAAQAGWRNLHLLDTFVLHTGGVSFGDSKSPRERAAMETLARLHPRYASDVHAFVLADPARPYRLALDVARIVDAGVPVVLTVLHDRAGGTVRHVRELAAHLADRAAFLTLAPGADQTVVLRMAGKDEGFELAFRLGDQYDNLIDVLRHLGVRLVHFHHLLGHSQAIRDLPHVLDVPYDFTAHDYYSYCTHISLTGRGHRYAGELGPGQCKCCPPDMLAPMDGTVAHWRGANARLLTGARHVLAPSHDTARRIAGFVPAARVHAVPHTDIARDTPLPLPSPVPLRAGVPLRIAVIGAMSAIKGADILEATALEAARRGAPVEFHLLGYGYRHLQTQPKSRLTVHGAYEEEDLPRLLAWLQPDIVWFPAQWPETYSYTLSAALLAGLPVMVPDLGAFAERVSGRPWSWVRAWDMDAKDWVETFTALHASHFVTGDTPAMSDTQPHPAAAPPPDEWAYDRDYLSDLASAPKAAALALDWRALQAYLPQPGTAAAAKSGLLGAVVYLRSMPLLREVARHIPAHWQRRVKNWLRA